MASGMACSSEEPPHESGVRNQFWCLTSERGEDLLRDILSQVGPPTHASQRRLIYEIEMSLDQNGEINF